MTKSETSRWRVGDRNRQLERCSPFGIEQADRPAMGVQHGADDGKAHAGAALLAPGGEKTVEDLRAVVGRDAFAIVGDFYPQQIFFAPGGYLQP